MIAKYSSDCHGKRDLIFVVDASGSIRDNCDNTLRCYDEVKVFISDLVSSFDIGRDETRVGLVTFSNQAQIRFVLNDHLKKEDLLSAIGSIPFGGGRTNMPAALQRVKNELMSEAGGNRADVDDTIILITDGKSTEEFGDPVPNANDIKNAQSKPTIITVGVTQMIDEIQLNRIASDSQSSQFETTYTVESFDELAQLGELIKNDCVGGTKTGSHLLHSRNDKIN